MTAPPSEPKSPKRWLHVATVAFVAGYLGGFFLWHGLIALSYPGHEWWAFWRADFVEITMFAIVGLCVAGVSLFIRQRLRRQR